MAQLAFGITAQEKENDAEEDWELKTGGVRDPGRVAGPSVLCLQSSQGTSVPDERRVRGELYWNSGSRSGRLGSAGAGGHGTGEGG